MLGPYETQPAINQMRSSLEESSSRDRACLDSESIIGNPELLVLAESLAAWEVGFPSVGLSCRIYPKSSEQEAANFGGNP